MMFFEMGSTPHSGTLNHIIGHHGLYFEPEFDTLNWRRADGSAMGKHEFSLTAALRHYPSCFYFGKGRKRLFRNFLAYSAICLALSVALILYKPAAALIIFVIPMMITLYMLKLAAYAHHSGLPIGDDFTASRTNTSWFYNWLTWNAGYHAAHHVKQALHWSRLPAFHAELAPRIPAELQGEKWGAELSRRQTRATPSAA